METKCTKCRFAALCLLVGKQRFVTQLVSGGNAGPTAKAVFDAVDSSICDLGLNPGLDGVAALKNELGRYGLQDTVEVVLEEA